MIQRALIFTGLIRNEDKFMKFLNFYRRNNAHGMPPLYFSTWFGELDKYPAVKDALIAINAHILEQQQPDLILPGHALHQITALDFPLSFIRDDVFIYKGRPDFASVDTFQSFMAKMPEKISASPIFPHAPTHKIYILGHFPAHPFYINDMIYCGMASDLKKNTNLSFTTLTRYNRVAPEQLIWGHWGFGLGWIDNYMRCNIGIIFNDAEKSQAYFEILKSSLCYAYALALHMIAIDAWFSDLQDHPHVNVYQQVANKTLEELLWSHIENNHISHHANAMHNTFKSTKLIPFIIAGRFKDSPFGELLKSAISDILHAHQPTQHQLKKIEVSALDFQTKINKAIHGIGGKCVENRGYLYNIEASPPPWIKQQTGTPLTQALEEEVNHLRRANNSLQDQIKAARL